MWYGWGIRSWVRFSFPRVCVSRWTVRRWPTRGREGGEGWSRGTHLITPTGTFETRINHVGSKILDQFVQTRAWFLIVGSVIHDYTFVSPLDTSCDPDISLAPKNLHSFDWFWSQTFSVVGRCPLDNGTRTVIYWAAAAARARTTHWPYGRMRSSVALLPEGGD